MKLVVVSAGLSVPSSTRLLGDRLAAVAAPAATAPEPGPADVQVIELRDLAVEIAHTFTNGFPAGGLAAAFDAVAGADGLIVVTPVFSASYSGLFKSFFDALSVSDPDVLAGKPVLIAATGGTARHSWSWTTRSGRSSPTCGPSSSRPASSPPRRTGARRAWTAVSTARRGACGADGRPVHGPPTAPAGLLRGGHPVRGTPGGPTSDGLRGARKGRA
ncbi:hypothetical protein SHKM778_06250 [Streptomyces sp. KM77-8]|uniref:NADPH-dependent FMN reductase-like domain-containing protein n=1 Tax=Streptomyces haneummycinicus TaxID=3074435 RepID=A0AAT9HA15_9ACTN